MKSSHALTAATVSLIIMLAAAAPDEKPAQAPSPLAGMEWIAGNWSGRMWGGEFNAWYSAPGGGKVMSFSALEKDGRTTYHEFEVFETDTATGKVMLRPVPKGRPAVSLTLATLDAGSRRAVFENKTKDFPTRIVYHRVDDDRLVITLSDPFGDSGKEEVFDLRRK